jgi:hypothetical protein
MLGRALAVRIEKDYNNMRMNLSSQREKAEESYRREFERLMNRKGDLDKQLRDMEKKMEVSQSAGRHHASHRHPLAPIIIVYFVCLCAGTDVCVLGSPSSNTRPYHKHLSRGQQWELSWQSKQRRRRQWRRGLVGG